MMARVAREQPMMRMIASAMVAVIAMPCLVAGVGAQGYPERAIKLVVPFPAGGATDSIARLTAQRLQAALGQTVVIENQGGAGGTIGTRQVARAAPDGYTLLMGSIGTFGSQPLLYKLDYDPHKAFTPVATVAIDRTVMVAGPALSVGSVQELLERAKANPGKLNYGNAIGIGPQLVAELFKIKTGADITHVPYRGGAPMIADLLAGQIDMTINGKSVLYPHIASGKIRALAVTAAKRWPELPDVPTLVELGYLDAPYDAMFGVVAPMGTPATAIARLNHAINEGLASPEMRAGFAALGVEPVIATPQEFSAVIASEVPKWAEVVRLIGAKAAQ
jgi:tripartite-type tricarboxylate transporter receptor subunit TctC